MFSQMKFHNLKRLSVCPRNTSGTGQTCLQQQLTGHKQKTCQCCQKRFRVKEKEENKKASAKLFAFHANTLTLRNRIGQQSYIYICMIL